MHLKGAAEETGVSYIQIKGESSNIKRQAVQAVYELKPTAKKNDLEDMTKNSFQMGWNLLIECMSIIAILSHIKSYQFI